MIDPRWYDKIAAAQSEAEEALMDAAAEDAAAEDMENAALTDAAVDEVAAEESEGLIAKLQEDIAIAQEVAATDLPTDVKVEILVNNDVDEAIIDDVIDADATDAVAAYYGLDPYWLHDKRAAMALDKLAIRDIGYEASAAAGKSVDMANKASKSIGSKAVNWLKDTGGKAASWAKANGGKAIEWSVKHPELALLGTLGLGNVAYFGHKALKRKKEAEPVSNFDLGAYASNPNTAALLGGGAGALGGAALGGLLGGGKGALAGGLTGAGLGGAAGYAFGPEAYERYGKK